MCFLYLLFFFNDTATTEIYTLSLHDALPISDRPQDLPRARGKEEEERLGGGDQNVGRGALHLRPLLRRRVAGPHADGEDRKSTRLNSRHANISYAVFCLKKKTNSNQQNLICQ